MQPAARLTAAIELLTEIEEKMAARLAPADVLVANFFRARRYAGSKDRRSVTGHIYAVLRNRELYLWALSKCRLEATPRAMMLIHLARTEPDSLSLFGEDNPFAPTKLTFDEEEAIGRAGRLDWASAPQSALGNIPAWALKGFQKRFGKLLDKAVAALNETAPMDIRVNALKVGDKKLDQILNKESELFEKNKYSCFGYRALEAMNLGGNKAYSGGLVEVQDEAAQVASGLVDARPGMQVLDLCAGAGGKTLAMASSMTNSGQIHAFDISGKRLNALKARVQRAGARNIQVHKIATEGTAREIAFAQFAEKADRVVVDAPCTGTGTWRRSPDQRWRFDDQALEYQTGLQKSLLAEAAEMVKPGGRLVYMTCSLLPDENETVVAAFLKAQPKGRWQMVDYRTVWAETLDSAPAETLASQPECLQLAPHTHGTDGFFVAILERQA